MAARKARGGRLLSPHERTRPRDLALEQVRREWIAAGRDLGGFHDNVSHADTGDDDIAFWDEVEAREVKLRSTRPSAPGETEPMRQRALARFMRRC